MMESVISLSLLATVASIGVAAAGILIIPWIPQPDWGRFAGRWGIRCACLFSAVLAGLLASQPQTEITTAATGLWTVFSLEEPPQIREPAKKRKPSSIPSKATRSRQVSPRSDE